VLLCLTANHHNANFDTLEKLSRGSAAVAGNLLTHPAISGAVVLATCNRFEAYLDVDGIDDVSAAAIGLVSATSGIDADALRDSLTVFNGEQVVEHLFAVSTGLESVIIGEDEISGQVRRSLEQARAEGTTTSHLELLFQNASHTSRTVKTHTAIGSAGRSLVRLALELASSRIADWTTQRVLVIGTGQYAGTTVAALRDRGVERIAVFSPSGRAEAFALRHSLAVASSLGEAFDSADLVLTCTASDMPVLTRETVGSPLMPAATVPTARYQLVIDLGLPRNVDPRLAEIDGIELLDLETVRLHAPLDELTATDDARSLVGQATAEFSALEAEQRVAPAIVALRSHLFDLLDVEIDRARARGDADGQAEAALRHLVGVLLHTPSSRARTLAREGRGYDFVAGLDALFGVQSSLQTDAAPAEDAATA
jgi:glutamyl-tRNA reductase